jgi:hypothetical protein
MQYNSGEEKTMDHQIFIERILENESLTGDLEDDPAARLLQWGTGQVPALVEGLDDEEAAGDRVNALMALMRQLGRTAANGLGAEAADLASELPGLLEHYTQVFGPVRETQAAELEVAAVELSMLPADQAVSFLLEWLSEKRG